MENVFYRILLIKLMPNKKSQLGVDFEQMPFLYSAH